MVRGFALLACLLGFIHVRANTSLSSNLERIEFNLGVGLSTYSGDIGSSFSHFGEGIYVGGKYYFSPRNAFKLNFSHLQLKGNDIYSQDYLIRGYSFTTPLTEVSAQMEFFLFKVAKNFGKIGFDRSRINQFNVYTNYGFGYAFFNPNTTLPEDINQDYKQTELILPVGIGLRLILNRSWNIDIDYTKRITTTDFIDGFGVLTSKDDTYGAFMIKVGYRLSRQYQ